jgi:single-stranded DNA-binding protein
MAGQHPKSKGGLWINRTKSGEQPDWRGKIAVSKAQINKLVEMGRSGIEPTLQLGAWKRRSEAGQNYIYLSAEAYIKPEGQQQQQQQQQSDGWGDDDSDDNWGQDQQDAPDHDQQNDFADDDIPF